jgi:hypothetical protein
MSVGIVISPSDRWETLQQPIHPNQLEPHHRSLLAALDQGWMVEAPIYIRPRWGETGARVYHIILRHSVFPTTRLLAVPQTSFIEALIRREGWAVA